MDTSQLKELNRATYDIAKNLGDQLLEHLRMQTVFFSILDEKAKTARLVGTGVAGDLRGTKVVFTAGHVVRELAGAAREERVLLSVNHSRGSYRVKQHAAWLVSAGDARGPDAGVLVLQDSDASSYFNFGGLDAVVRSTTVQATMPPVGMLCFIAGYPGELTTYPTTIDERTRTIENSVLGTLFVAVSAVVEVDGVHAWLGTGGPPLEMSSDKPIDVSSLNGVSGGGCWSVAEIDHASKELKLALHAVHTATVFSPTGEQRLRQTPMIHHLRLLADMNTATEEKVKRLWPGAAL